MLISSSFKATNYIPYSVLDSGIIPFPVDYGVGFPIRASIRVNPIDLKYILYNRETKGIKGIYVKLRSLLPAPVALLLTAFYHHGSRVISTFQSAFTSRDDIMYIIYVNIVVIIFYDLWVLEALYCTV